MSFRTSSRLPAAILLLAVSAVIAARVALPAADAPVVGLVDTARSTHRISPLIYGVSWADAAAVQDLRLPFNRWGGNHTTTYNWQDNCFNHGSDWFFQSLPRPEAAPGAEADSFIRLTRAGGAQAAMTIPAIGWIAALGPGRSRRSSFSVAKYGPQQATDREWYPDAGNGLKPDGTPITGNDPSDASTPNSPEFQAAWIHHLRRTWGPASAGGVRHYTIDNEPCLWHETHRDVHPAGASMEELRDRFIAFAAMVRQAEPDAEILGPESWGYLSWIVSGLDQASIKNGGPRNADRQAHGNAEFMPWFLAQIAAYQRDTGTRVLDILTTHLYPLSGEFSEDVSEGMCERRNRSTRILWDPGYVDDSWIGRQGISVAMIPRLKRWVAESLPGLRIGLTEYCWGADQHMNGATAQADVLGILGREGIHCAARWTCPKPGTPVYQVFKLMRNHDGNGGGFGDLALSIANPDPDRVALFAAARSEDGALTVLVVSKTTASRRVVIDLGGTRAPAGAKLHIVEDGLGIRDGPALPAGTRLELTPPPRSVILVVAPEVFARGGPPLR